MIILCLFAFSKHAFPVVYYVSSAGSDLNSGLSTSSPWQSISKVNSMMSSLNPGDQILFNKGDTFEGMLTITKSGTAGSYITFGSYGSGNLPVISGRKIITGWTVYSGNIYRATVSDTVSNVYINGKLISLARYPNTGFLRTDASSSNTGFYDAQLNQSSGFWNGANCRIRTKNWAYEIRTVSAFNAGNVTFSSPTTYSAYNSNGYYFDNKLIMLDVPDEWFYDKAAGYLYLIATGGVNPNTVTVEASVRKYCIYANLHIDYIIIQDIEVSKCKDHGIEMYGSDYITIRNCRINNTPLFGIRINGLYNTIQNNFFEDNLGSAVTGVINNGLVKDNVINRTGIIPGYGQSGWGYIALQLNVCQNTTIESNRIDSTGYVGISVAKNCLVQKNIIDYSCLLLNDGGGIDVTDCDSLKILNNIITNSIGSFETNNIQGSYCSGIYINGAAMKNTTIQGNTLCYNRYMGMHVDHKSNPVNNKILDNVCYNNFVSQIMFTDYSTTTFVPSYNTLIKRNILYGLSNSQTCIEVRGHTSSGISDFGLFDSNYYCNPYTEFVVRRTNFQPAYVTNIYSFANWQANYNEDLNSKAPQIQFEQYGITDTLSNNMITNSQFTNNLIGWTTWPVGSTIAQTTHPLLNGGCMRIRWNGQGWSECLTMSNGYPIVKGSTYLVSVSCAGNHPGIFNMWGRSSFNPSLATFPQTFMSYNEYRKNYSFTFKADTTDPAAFVSVGLKLPDSLIYVDDITIYKVNVSKIDSTQTSKIFINENNFPANISLGSTMYKNLDGIPVYGNISLEPYSSVILINENYVNPNKNLQLHVLLQEFYDEIQNSTITDTVRVFLRNDYSPYEIIDSAKSLCDANGNCSFTFTRALNSINYYLEVNHRNSIETWSKLPVVFTAGFLDYDFTQSADKAFGNNMIQKGTKYCIYGSDVTQNGIVDIHDIALVDNASAVFLTGYQSEDINGDLIVDLSDMISVSNNASFYIQTERP